VREISLKVSRPCGVKPFIGAGSYLASFLEKNGKGLA